MKVNGAYIVLYIVIVIFFIFVSFYIIKFLYTVSCLPYINDVVGPLREHTLGIQQPIMVPLNWIYAMINAPQCHLVYAVILCIAAFVLVLTLIFWMIGMVIQKIFLMGENPLAHVNAPPIFFWGELNKMGFFKWFFERTMIDKNKDVIRFFLNIFKSILTPAEYEAAQQRCLERFASKAAGNSKAVSMSFPVPNKEYIDYNFDDRFDDDKKKDMFYRDSYKSVKHREDANRYRNMVIARPNKIDVLPQMPDITNTLKTQLAFANLLI
jgi:hypothetical protein